jgi:leucyl aminopeptidase
MLPTLLPLRFDQSDLANFDALVAVFTGVDQLVGLPLGLGAAAQRLAAIDQSVLSSVNLSAAAAAPGDRLILAPTGPLLRDQDDVRRVADAAAAGLRRAVAAGARRPALWIAPLPQRPDYENGLLVGVLGALAALWQPLEAREALGEAAVEPVEALGFFADGSGPEVAAQVSAIEAGRRLARDLGGTEPERMSPLRMAALLRGAFAETDVQVSVLDDVDQLGAGYPLLMAVARASLSVPRHRPCVVRLEWTGPGPTTRTLLFAGKGLSYDTGGADLKTDGHMAGMSRDKGGAAAVAGFVLAASRLGVPGLRIVAELGCVRNSIGPDAFVADEIIRSHGGARVRIGNTDAEGRLVLADLLSHLREDALQCVDPHLFTVATLTGHAGRAVGPYTIVMDNGPALAADTARGLERVGDRFGDGVAPSRLRREDWDFIAPRSRADDLLSCNNAPSSATSRGHQFPMAFLIRAAGLEGHGGDSAQPLRFSHIDIGGSGVEGGDWQHGRPTGAPIVALAGAYLLG